jgi:hypothetical protein
VTSFTDDFNRADSTNLGANWVEVSGDWSIVSNQLSPGAAGGTIVLRAAGAMATNDNSAQATIAATAVASQGVWCRGNASITQGYLWRNNGTQWDLFSVVGGAFTSIGTYTAAAVAGDVAKVQAVGTAIKGFVNGVQRVSVTSSTVTTGTSVGIRSDSAGALRYDDFTGADVTAGATLAIAASVETAQPLTGAMAATLGIAAESSSAQALVGAKAATLSLAAAVESAQPLTGAKTASPSPAAATDTAQPVTGAKAGALAFAAASESAQALAGTMTAPLGTAAAIETAQSLPGSKAVALGTALETDAGQGLAGAKAAPLPIAAQTEAAQPLAGTTSPTLGVAVSIQTAQPLAGAKAAVLGPAVEIGTTRPIVLGPASRDIDFTIRAAPERWTACEPAQSRWTVGAGTQRWTAREPDA